MPKTLKGKYISLDWLHKTLIDMRYDGEISSETWEAFRKIIAKWAKENDKRDV